VIECSLEVFFFGSDSDEALFTELWLSSFELLFSNSSLSSESQLFPSKSLKLTLGSKLGNRFIFSSSVS